MSRCPVLSYRDTIRNLLISNKMYIKPPKKWSNVNCVHQVIIKEGNKVENEKVHKRDTLSECVDKKFAEVPNLNLG